MDEREGRELQRKTQSGVSEQRSLLQPRGRSNQDENLPELLQRRKTPLVHWILIPRNVQTELSTKHNKGGTLLVRTLLNVGAGQIQTRNSGVCRFIVDWYIVKAPQT